MNDYVHQLSLENFWTLWSRKRNVRSDGVWFIYYENIVNTHTIKGGRETEKQFSPPPRPKWGPFNCPLQVLVLTISLITTKRTGWLPSLVIDRNTLYRGTRFLFLTHHRIEQRKKRLKVEIVECRNFVDQVSLL